MPSGGSTGDHIGAIYESLIVGVSCATLNVAGAGQQPSSKSPLQETTSKWLRGEPIEGRGLDWVRKGGDAAAAAIKQALSDHKPDTSEIEAALYLLAVAFSDSRSIMESANREPREALLLLQYLRGSTSDAALQARMTEETPETNGAGHEDRGCNQGEPA